MRPRHAREGGPVRGPARREALAPASAAALGAFGMFLLGAGPCATAADAPGTAQVAAPPAAPAAAASPAAAVPAAPPPAPAPAPASAPPAAPTPPAAPAELAIDCRVAYQTADGLYVDAGSESGLELGGTGFLVRGGERLARVEVAEVASGTALLRLLDAAGATGPLPGPGEPVTLRVSRAPEASAPEPAAGEARRPATSPTLKRPGDDAAFVPLLATAADQGGRATTEARNVFHGRVTLRQLFQHTTSGDQDYALTRLRTSGSLERIDATPWALEWSGELSYRTGDGLARSRDHEQVRPELFRLALYRRFDDRSLLRLGRFLPRELPAIGFIDGVHGEVAVDGRFRFGVVGGFKPTLERLTPSADEPTFATYMTVNVGDDDGPRYFGTVGLLFSLYEGDPDRLAILLDQRVELGDWSLSSSSEVDLDVDPDDTREGTRLTRWNLLARWQATSELGLFAGLDRFEVVDSGAERDAFDRAVGGDDDELFEDDGSWRYRAGLQWRLPADLVLTGEVSFTDDDDEDAVRGYASLTLGDLPGFSAGTITLSAFTLRADETEGYGARLSAYLPLLAQRLVLLPGVGFRYADHDTAGDRFFDPVTEGLAVVDASLRAQWLLSRSWTLAGGVQYTRVDGDDRILVDVSVSATW